MTLLGPYFENKHHIIWDWNGTLLSDIDHAVTTVNRLLVEEGLKPTNVAEYKQAFGFPVVNYYEALGFDVSPEKFHELCVRFNSYFYGGIGHCELWPGAKDILKMIHQSGKCQSVLSASEQSMLEHSIRHFEIEHLFHHVFGIADKKAASKVGRGHELMSASKINPKHTVLVGDTDHDLEVGEALGIDVILVEHGHQCHTRLKAKHSTVVKVL